MPRKELILEGLDCANCAAKIEHEVNALEGVKAAVNFVTKTLTLETAPEADGEGTLKKVASIIHKLEPGVTVTEKAPAGPADEDAADRKKAVIRLAAGGALFAAGLIFSRFGGPGLPLYLAAYLVLGFGVITRAVKGIFRGRVFSEHFLMTVATVGAFFIGEYAEGVAVMLFYLTGELFESLAVGRSRRSIAKLMDIRPEYATVKTARGVKTVPPESVGTGELILVKPGEKIPLDGKVLEGVCMADTSALTGESMPRELKPGDDALSGFIVLNGALTVAVTKRFEDSTVSKILDLVQNASARKAPTENFITKFAKYYTPAVVFGALALAVIPPLAIPGAAWGDWVYRALVFLVVSCPCALVISIPLGFFGGIGGASKHGILIKGGNYLEALNRVGTVVFDKTGTLTKGVFKVTAVNPENGFTAGELLEYAACAESYSSHPIAVSIAAAFGHDNHGCKIGDYREMAGNGVKVIVNGKEILAGSAKLMKLENIDCCDGESFATVVHVAVEGIYAGSIEISDEIKEDAEKAVRELKRLGVGKTVMLTGDLKATGDSIGRKLGIDEVHAGLLPADKVEKFEELERGKKPGSNIAFAGDGINDAPVLARADIGIAMGGLGSDAAIEAADIVIMTDEPSKIAAAIRIARKTRRVVTQNMVFAFGVKAVFLALGAFGVASMWEAVFGDMGVALIAIFNAMRVMNTKKL